MNNLAILRHGIRPPALAFVLARTNLRVLLGIALGAASFHCEASELPRECGTLPIATQEQAICATMHFLRMKSEACLGISGFSYTAIANGSSWQVRVIPQEWEKEQKCTGDDIELDGHSGSLLKWERIKYRP